jgi:acyl carrier protein
VDAVEQLVRCRLANALGCPVEHIKPEARLVEDLDADSLDLLVLLVDAEEEFDISIPALQARTLHVVADVVALVRNHVGNRSGANEARLTRPS